MTVDAVRSRLSDGPRLPLAELLGMEIELVEHGRVVAAFEASGRFANPFGTLHGGIIATLLDSVMGMAALTTAPEDAATTTLGLEVKYLRAVAIDAGRLRAEGVAVHTGKRVLTADGRFLGPDGRLLATATTTCLVL